MIQNFTDKKHQTGYDVLTDVAAVAGSAFTVLTNTFESKLLLSTGLCICTLFEHFTLLLHYTSHINVAGKSIQKQQI